jgi:protoheme IX farnesyltransferase
MVLISALLLIILNIQTWRNFKHSNMILVASTVSLILFISQALLGSQMVVGFPTYLLFLHRATAVAVFITLVILILSILTESNPIQSHSSDTSSNSENKTRFLEFFKLTKPIVVALLLVTTYAGMLSQRANGLPLKSFSGLSWVVFWLQAVRVRLINTLIEKMIRKCSEPRNDPSLLVRSHRQRD